MDWPAAKARAEGDDGCSRNEVALMNFRKDNSSSKMAKRLAEMKNLYARYPLPL